MRTARPPTTPPAIALTLVLLGLPLVVGFDVLVEMVRVAALMLVNDGVRSKYTAKSLLSHVAGFNAVAPPVGLNTVRMLLEPYTKLDLDSPASYYRNNRRRYKVGRDFGIVFVP